MKSLFWTLQNLTIERVKAQQDKDKKLHQLLE